MKKYIYESMINYLKTCYSGRYGELKVMDVYTIFKDKTDECLKYIYKTKIINVSTYSGIGGTYKGIGGIHSINDNKLKILCDEAWKNNPDRKRSLNSW